MFAHMEYKLVVFTRLLDGHTFEGLPSYREAKIQLAKLDRLKEKFEKKYPALLLALPHKKVNKLYWQDSHGLQQQSKTVDRLCMKLFEEHVKRHLEKNEPGKKITKGVIKKVAQQYIESLNSASYAAYQSAFKKAFYGARDVLGGPPKEIGS